MAQPPALWLSCSSQGTSLLASVSVSWALLALLLSPFQELWCRCSVNIGCLGTKRAPTHSPQLPGGCMFKAGVSEGRALDSSPQNSQLKLPSWPWLPEAPGQPQELLCSPRSLDLESCLHTVSLLMEQGITRVCLVICLSWVGCVDGVNFFSTPVVITETFQNNKKRAERERERKQSISSCPWEADERRGVPYLINLTVLDKSVSLLWCRMFPPLPKGMETSLSLMGGGTQEEEPCPHPALPGMPGIAPRGLAHSAYALPP